MKRRFVLFTMLGALVVASCGSDEPADTGVASAFHAAAADSVVVSGTAMCDFSDEGVAPEGGSGLLVICELDMSDSRVSGTERHDQFRFLVGNAGNGVWVAEDATIENEEGIWRGRAQAAERPGVMGEAHYVGEGAYEGLEFHYYFVDIASVEDPLLHGWISEVG